MYIASNQQRTKALCRKTLYNLIFLWITKTSPYIEEHHWSMASYSAVSTWLSFAWISVVTYNFMIGLISVSQFMRRTSPIWHKAALYHTCSHATVVNLKLGFSSNAKRYQTYYIGIKFLNNFSGAPQPIRNSSNAVLIYATDKQVLELW